MRIIKEIPHPDYRITLFHWNNKYIVKLETARFEQTYKVDQFEFASDDEALKILDKEFIHLAMQRFENMAADLSDAIKRAENL